MKTRRQAAIVRKIKEHVITSQSQIVEMLEKDGFTVSQTTVSRDIGELGLIKGRDRQGNIRYADAGTLREQGRTDSGLMRVAPQFLLTVETSGNLVVAGTSPGNAQGLAAAIDAATIRGVAGTVAGDDTILIICSNGVSSEEIARTLLEYSGDRG